MFYEGETILMSLSQSKMVKMSEEFLSSYNIITLNF